MLHPSYLLPLLVVDEWSFSVW